MSKQTPYLPTFLPSPGEKLQQLLPLAHESLASVLGLTLAYMQTMHPTKQPKSDPAMVASAHILSLFIHNPLIEGSCPLAAVSLFSVHKVASQENVFL
jgi:hypothetical protein